MFNLIKKDILIQKGTFKLMLAYIFILIIVMGQMSSDGKYLIYIMTFVFSFVITSFFYDEKYKAQFILNSLPIKRRDIVLSKYLSVFIYTIASFIIIGGIGGIIAVLHLPFNIGIIKLNVIKISFIASILMCSINFPLLFKFGYRKGKFIFTVIYFGMFGVILSLFDKIDVELLKIYEFMNNNMTMINLISSILVILIFITSIIISISIYNKRDLC